MLFSFWFAGWLRAAVHWLAAWFVFMPPRVRVTERAPQPMLVERPAQLQEIAAHLAACAAAGKPGVVLLAEGKG